MECLDFLDSLSLFDMGKEGGLEGAQRAPTPMSNPLKNILCQIGLNIVEEIATKILFQDHYKLQSTILIHGKT